MRLFNGSGVALITPMTAKGVDYEALEQLVDWHLEAGSDALILTGTTGESATLSDDEKCGIYAAVVKQVKGQVPIIAGTGSNNTASVIALSRQAQAIGVDGLLVVTPYYNKPTQRGLYEHFKAIANAVEIPMILYNVPSRTSVDLLPETVVALAKIVNISGIKEAKGDLERIKQLAGLCPKGFKVYSGNDHDIVSVIENGGHGVITVLGNITPDVTHALCQKAFQGKWDEAYALQAHLMPLVDALFCETNPAPVKTALSFMGYCSPLMRLPLVELEDTNANRLKALLKAYGLLEGGLPCASSF